MAFVCVTPADLKSAYDKADLTQASNLREPGSGLNDQRIKAACERASGTIYGYLIRRFEESDLSSLSEDFLEVLRTHGIPIARYYLDDSLQAVVDAAKQSFDWLEQFTDPRSAGGGIGNKPDITDPSGPRKSIGYNIRKPTWSNDRLSEIGLD